MNQWPFVVEPPDPSYTGQGGTVVTATRRAATVGAVISYGLTIAFDDDEDNHRTMYIDPDMIIDS
jgi:hypothetical protein